jgi:hypothetical protein
MVRHDHDGSKADDRADPAILVFSGDISSLSGQIDAKPNYGFRGTSRMMRPSRGASVST